MIFLVKIFSKNSDVSFKHLIQGLQHRNGNMYRNEQGHSVIILVTIQFVLVPFRYHSRIVHNILYHSGTFHSVPVFSNTQCF